MPHLRCGIDDTESEFTEGPLEENECGTDESCERKRTSHDAQGFILTAGSIGLGGETTGAHTEEIEEPIDHVEDESAHGYGSDVGCRTEMPHDGGVDEGKEGDGDVRDDAGDGDMEYLAIHYGDLRENMRHAMRLCVISRCPCCRLRA